MVDRKPANQEGTAIKVTGVSKAFKLPHEKQNSVKGMLIGLFRSKRTFERQQVLKDINFDIKKGEFFGIVGRNGSGKSTLLKLLAGIYTPDKGSIQINGKLTPFIELGVGFNPELTGRENVFLNGALLGFNRKEMLAMYDEIVEFAELEKFMDQKLKNYSSGMQVRLAFSIAIRANSDILVLDEVLAVGDANFQKKCFEYFSKIKNEKRTVILVTHDMNITKKYCNRSLLLDEGDIILKGTPDMVSSAYNKINASKIEESLTEQNKKTLLNRNQQNEILVKRVWTEGANGKKKTIFTPDEKINILCEVTSHEKSGPFVVTLRCNIPGGPIIFAVSSKRKKLKLSLKGGDSITLKWEVENIFNDGPYLVTPSVFSADLTTNYQELVGAYQFEITGRKWPHSLTHPSDKLSVVS